MKKVLVMMVVLAVATAFGQQPPQQQQTPPPAGTQPQTQPGQAGQAQPGQAQPGAAGQPQQKKEIKDQAEYNAYMSALRQTDPAAKAAAFESFLQQYPNTVMKPEALEGEMVGYNQAGNPQKTIEAANQLVQVDPTNVAALGILADYERKMAQSGTDPQKNLALAAQHAQAGMQALQSKPKPEGMSDPDYQKLTTTLSGIFNGALGISALQNKDYATAQQDLRKAAEVSPNDYSLVYPLALSYLQAQPPQYVDGLFFLARAVDLASAASPQTAAQIAKYGQGQYTKYHGSPEGWDQVLAAAKASPVPPPGFAIKAAPTPAEQAHALLQSKPVAQMDFGEMELILSLGTPEDQQALWNQIKDKRIKMEGFLLNATPTKLMIAGTVDANQAKKPDIELNLAAPLPRATVVALKEGQTIQFEGEMTSYNNTPAPAVAATGAQPAGAAAAAQMPNFILVMSKGDLLKPAATAKPPAGKAPARRPGTRKPPAK